MLNPLKADYSAVVDEVKKSLTLGEIQKVLQQLLAESVSIRNMVPILETLADYAAVSKDIGFLTEKTRQRLKRQITTPYLNESGNLMVLTLSPSIEQLIKESAVDTVGGLVPALEPAMKSRIMNVLTNSVHQVQQQGVMPIILTSEMVRRLFRQMIVREYPQLVVLSVLEVADGVQILPMGEINIEMERVEL